MALSIKDRETDELARQLAEATGESLTEAVRSALRERLERTRRREPTNLGAAVRRIQERLSRLPVIDDRSADSLLGYDEHGLPR